MFVSFLRFSTIFLGCPLEGYRAGPGKILSHSPHLKSGDHVPPPMISSWEVLVVVFVVLVLVLVILGVALMIVEVVASHYCYHY